MDSISIRPAVSADLAGIAGIELAAATMFPEADLPHSIRHKVTASADLSAAMDNGRLWVAVTTSGQLAGFAMAGVADGQAFLEEVDVLPDQGRRGTGTRLVATVIDWARASGYATLLLVTFRHLAWNAPFYERLGFSILKSSQHGTEIAGLMEQEARAGIDIAKRVAMRLEL